jgi:hypothetical protein
LSTVRRKIKYSGKSQRMAELDENERRIINEFCQLQEKSKQLFNGLR